MYIIHTSDKIFCDIGVDDIDNFVYHISNRCDDLLNMSIVVLKHDVC